MDEERSSDTSETYGSQDAPGSASEQNTEEPSAPIGGGSAQGGSAESGGGSQSGGAGASGHDDEGTEGGAGEHSQATGSPDAAG